MSGGIDKWTRMASRPTYRIWGGRRKSRCGTTASVKRKRAYYLPDDRKKAVALPVPKTEGQTSA